jgi:predicted nuclease with TOPRIM domain
MASDPPDNIDLHRHLVEMRDELQAFSRNMSSLRDEMQGLRDQVGVVVASLFRVERNLSAVRQDIHALFDADRDLRRRHEALEETRQP